MNRFLVICLAVLVAQCSGEGYRITHSEMQNQSQLKWEEDSTVLVLSGNTELSTMPLQLSRGKYTLRFSAKGSTGTGTTPGFEVWLGEFTVKHIRADQALSNYKFNFELPKSIEAPLRFVYHDESGQRNFFLHYPVIVEPY